jgi:hypothetical protein
MNTMKTKIMKGATPGLQVYRRALPIFVSEVG